MAGEGKFIATALFVPLPTSWITWAMQRLLKLGCWGPKLLLGMKWRPRSLRADFKSVWYLWMFIGTCWNSQAFKILSPSIDWSLSLRFLATRHIFDQGSNDHWLVSIWAVWLFSRRAALASLAVCSSAPLSCTVCLQSGSWHDQTYVESSSKRLWPSCVQILSSLWVRQISLNYNSFGQAEQPSGVRWRRQGTSLGCFFCAVPKETGHAWLSYFLSHTGHCRAEWGL